MTAIVLELCADAMHRVEKNSNPDNLKLVGIGWSARTGSLEAGKWADIIPVDKNPLDDVKVLQIVKFVMKSGAVYKNESKQGSRFERDRAPAAFAR